MKRIIDALKRAFAKKPAKPEPRHPRDWMYHDSAGRTHVFKHRLDHDELLKKKLKP